MAYEIKSGTLSSVVALSMDLMREAASKNADIKQGNLLVHAGNLARRTMETDMKLRIFEKGEKASKKN